MKAIVPKTFRTGAIVDSEDVNANLQAIARDLGRNIGQRYTYCSIPIDVSGLNDTDTAAERTIPFSGPVPLGGTEMPLDIVGVEFSVYGAVGDTWTLSTTDENGTVLALAVATVTATSEGYGSSNVPLQLTTGRLDFVLSCPTTATITRGTVTLHLRADRHSQVTGNVAPSYTPALVDASTSTAATAINAELLAASVARTADVASRRVVRGCCLVANDLAAAQTWRLPSGAEVDDNTNSMFVTAVGVAARTATASDGTNSAAPVCTGLSDIVTGIGALVAKLDDPTDTADDLVVTLTPTGGTISRVFVFLWWS